MQQWTRLIEYFETRGQGLSLILDRVNGRPNPRVMRPAKPEDVQAVRDLMVWATAQKDLLPADRLDRLYEVYWRATRADLGGMDVEDAARTLRSLLVHGKTPEQLERAVLMGRVSDSAAIVGSAVTGYLGTWGLSNRAAARLVQDGRDPVFTPLVTNLTVPTGARLSGSVIRRGGMMPFWTSEVVSRTQGGALQTVRDDNGRPVPRAADTRQLAVMSFEYVTYAPTLLASSLVADSPLLHPADHKAEVRHASLDQLDFRFKWNILAATGLGMARLLFDRVPNWLTVRDAPGAIEGRRERFLHAAIEELTSPGYRALAAATWPFRPLTGLMGVIAGRDVEDAVHQAWTMRGSGVAIAAGALAGGTAGGVLGAQVAGPQGGMLGGLLGAVAGASLGTELRANHAKVSAAAGASAALWGTVGYYLGDFIAGEPAGEATAAAGVIAGASLASHAARALGRDSRYGNLQLSQDVGHFSTLFLAAAVASMALAINAIDSPNRGGSRSDGSIRAWDAVGNQALWLMWGVAIALVNRQQTQNTFIGGENEARATRYQDALIHRHAHHIPARASARVEVVEVDGRDGQATGGLPGTPTAIRRETKSAVHDEVAASGGGADDPAMQSQRDHGLGVGSTVASPDTKTR